MTFEEYLVQKKIDSKKFREFESERYTEFEEIFLQVHPNSFTVQKLNLINFIRRKYPLIPESVSSEGTTQTGEPQKASTRPVFKRK